MQAESPRTAPFYVVRNTFVEMVDENSPEHTVEEASAPLYRRRRGSSFFRCSSEPLVGARSGNAPDAGCQEFPLDTVSTEDEGSDGGRSTLEVSPATSREASPSPGEFSPVYANMVRVPKVEPVRPAHLFMAPTLHGYCANWNAMAMQDHSQQYMSATYQTQQAHTGHLPLFFEAHKTPFAPQMQFEQPRACAREASPFGNMSSNLSDAGTAVSGISKNDESKQPCHLIWCDHRAFKDTSSALKEQLEKGSGVTVKTHKTAENCIRLFRKKQRAQGRPPCVLLVSWANAPALLSYLSEEAQQISVKVVVLCDTRCCRKNENADQLAVQFPFVEKIVTSWEEAVESACNAVAAFQ